MRDGDAVWDGASAGAEPGATAAAQPEPESGGVAGRLAPLLAKIMLGDAHAGPDTLPIRVLAWDGSAVGPAGAPVFVVRHRRALRRLLWKPGELGLVRAYVAGELDIEGDVSAALGAVQRVMRDGAEPIRLSGDDKRDIVRTAVTLGAVGPEPKPPPEEFAPADRDAHAGPMREPAAFFARILGDGLPHGIGQWDGAPDLGAAQSAAHAAVAGRLGLFPGARLLDLDCGWGAFARYATAAHGARVVGLARTSEQAEHVRAHAGPGVDARGFDLADAGDGPYDAIVGLAGVAPAARPAARLRELLAPGGRLVLRGPVRRPGPHPARRTLTTGYLVPDDGEPPTLGALVDDLDEAGLDVRAVEPLREHYATTLRAWAAGLQQHWDECETLAGPGRSRVWLLYLAASALACESGRLGGHEIRAIRRDREGRRHP